MNKPPVTGTPAAWESVGMWVHAADGTLPDGNEFEDCVEKMDRALERWLKRQGHCEGDCYFRWDFFGDRTQYLEVNKPELLGEHLIEFVQRELKKKWPHWRVVIPTPEVPRDAVMIYPDVIRVWNEGTAPLAELLLAIRTKMKCVK
ncbi:hypothetical protein [Verrucomicrobium sp. BvORR106]|uniref:hypothetical protein n=1 Tax=Verrucomicrobium sp. BvORR106 TaxID=1403819 RepID=UPI002240FE2D|nr:hypothetical protein [Verrucomicrobium sp. BvORR106]